MRVWSTHSSNIYASGTYAWSIGRHAHPFGAEQVNWQWHGSHSVGRTHSFGRVILSTVSLWLAHLSLVGTFITRCPWLVGTFRCAGHVIHYWSAHSLCAGHVVHYWSVVRDMYWSGAGQVARFGLALIGGGGGGCMGSHNDYKCNCSSLWVVTSRIQSSLGCDSIAWEAITIHKCNCSSL